MSSEGKVSQLAVQCPSRFVIINVDTNEPVALEFPVIKKALPLLMQPINATEMLMAYTRTRPGGEKEEWRVGGEEEAMKIVNE